MRRNESFTDFGMGDGTEVPLHQRMRVGNAGAAAAWSGNTDGKAEVRQAFLPPALAQQLSLPIEEHPEYSTRMNVAIARAEKEGMAQAEQKIGAAIEQFAQGTERLLVATKRIRMPRAGEIADMAIAIARQLVSREISIDSRSLAETVQKLIDGVESPLPLVLHLCPSDADSILAAAPEIGQSARIVRDLHIASGGFLLENIERIVDATVDARLDKVRLALVPFLDEYLAERGANDAGGETP
ncbi:MAG: FliH/SctL family protein [Deltaproteobacteria bacterium]|nr:FliH/SctL family protein [Deltaproteobacteria bacterium]